MAEILKDLFNVEIIRFIAWIFLGGSSTYWLYGFKRKRVARKSVLIEQEEMKRLGPLMPPSEISHQIDTRFRELKFFENTWFGVSVFVALVVLSYICFFAFRQPLSRNPEEWGQLGDFFGGVLNPGLAFASFIALLYTIRIQSEELRLTRDELSKSAIAQQQAVDNQGTQIKIQALLEDYSSIRQLLVNNLDELRTLYTQESEMDAFTDHRSVRFLYLSLNRAISENVGIKDHPNYWDVIGRELLNNAAASPNVMTCFSTIYELAFSAKKQYERMALVAGSANSTYFHASLISYAELISNYLVVALLYKRKAPQGEAKVKCSLLCSAIRDTCNAKELPLPPYLKLEN